MLKKYSGKKVIKAGEDLIKVETLADDEAFDAAFDILSYWRFSHEKPLENALSILKEITLKKDKNAIFAKRLKRYISIVMKLRRFPEMKLKNMQDIGGCRAIVSNQKKVYQIVRELKRKQEFHNENGKVRYKDYIESPKEDGYRGYHLIGKFDGADGEKRSIELQVRTRLQHDWATTLEIVDLFTGQALKSNQGEIDWKEFFSAVSQQFALMESIHLFDTMSNEDKSKKYINKLFEESSQKKERLESCIKAQDYTVKLDVIRILEAYAHSLKVADARMQERKIDGYVLLEVDTVEATVTSSLFDNDKNEEAEKMYAEAEKRATEKDGLVVALVSTTAIGGIKEAYPNYFADSTEFLKHLVDIKLANAKYELSKLTNAQ